MKYFIEKQIGWKQTRGENGIFILIREIHVSVDEKNSDFQLVKERGRESLAHFSMLKMNKMNSAMTITNG